MDQSDIKLSTIDLKREGRMISPLKSAYLARYPDNLVAFNGGIFTKSSGNIWSGDLDVTRDTPRLQEIARDLGETIYILRESDSRKTAIPWDNAIASFDGKS